MAVGDVSHASLAMAAQCIAGRGYNPLKVIVSRHALHYTAADRLQTEEHTTILFTSSRKAKINSTGGDISHVSQAMAAHVSTTMAGDGTISS